MPENQRCQKGFSLYLTIMVMSIMIVIAFAIAGLFSSQLGILRNTTNSVSAFYAAETGIEMALYSGWLPETPNQPKTGILDDNNASYSVWIIAPGSDCSALNYCVKSIGVYKDTRRGIRISR